jgi:CRP-like cAMP-binding protein
VVTEQQTQTGKPAPITLCSLFGELDTSACSELSAITRTERHAAGDVIFRQGDPGSSMVVILTGRVRISTTSADGKGLILAVLGPGQVLGEIALLVASNRRNIG